MRQSLYGENGYYTNSHRVGKGGDFYTAVSTTKFFGGAIAFYILKLLESGKLTLPLSIVEIGADKGFLLCDIAQFLDELSVGIMDKISFCIIEPLDSLHITQEQNFSALNLSCESKLQIFSDISKLQDFQNSVIFVSNELFDSFPCDVLLDSKDLAMALCVEADSKLWSAKFVEINNLSNSDASKIQALSAFHKKNLESKYIILPHWEEFIKQVATCAKQYKNAYFLSFDYGFVKNFAFNQVRFYHKHKVLNLSELLETNADFRALYKCVDITYSVDFAKLESYFKANGFQKEFLDSQSRILLQEFDILSLLDKFLSSKQGARFYSQEALKIRTLLDMGSNFFGICYKM